MVNDRCWTSLLGPGHVGTGLIWAVVDKKIVFPKLNICIRYSKEIIAVPAADEAARKNFAVSYTNIKFGKYDFLADNSPN